MVNCVQQRRVMVGMVLLVALSVSLSACEPLRKKFIRQKKKDAAENKDFIPVLEPQEYPAPENDPQNNYKDHYAMVKVWYKDLWTAIEVRDKEQNDRKEKYTLTQLTNHLDEMRKLLVPEQQVQIDQLASLLKYYTEALQQSPQMRNYARIQSDLRAFYHLLLKLNANKLQGSFVQASS